jgi:hypothetical protein
MAMALGSSDELVVVDTSLVAVVSGAFRGFLGRVVRETVVDCVFVLFAIHTSRSRHPPFDPEIRHHGRPPGSLHDTRWIAQKHRRVFAMAGPRGPAERVS